MVKGSPAKRRLWIIPIRRFESFSLRKTLLTTKITTMAERKLHSEITTIVGQKDKTRVAFNVREGIISDACKGWEKFKGKRHLTLMCNLQKEGFRIFIKWTM